MIRKGARFVGTSAYTAIYGFGEGRSHGDLFGWDFIQDPFYVRIVKILTYRETEAIYRQNLPRLEDLGVAVHPVYTYSNGLPCLIKAIPNQSWSRTNMVYSPDRTFWVENGSVYVRRRTMTGTI